MKRFYICKVYGNGDIDAPYTPTTGPYRPALADIVDPATGIRAFNWSQECKVNPDNTLAHPWSICIAAGMRHGLAASHPDCDPLPDFGLDVKIASMHVPTKNGMFAKMQARGINTTGFSNADGFRDVIRAVGRLHNPNFDESNFDAPE